MCLWNASPLCDPSMGTLNIDAGPSNLFARSLGKSSARLPSAKIPPIFWSPWLAVGKSRQGLSKDQIPLEILHRVRARRERERREHQRDDSFHDRCCFPFLYLVTAVKSFFLFFYFFNPKSSIQLHSDPHDSLLLFPLSLSLSLWYIIYL